MHSGAAAPRIETPEGKRLRVLAIAEAANPEWVSVPLVGWSLAKALMAHHDVHLVTQIRNRDAILRAGLVEGRDFTAIDSEAVAAPVYRLAEKLRMGEGKGWTMVQALSSRLAYPYFERKVWQHFGPALTSGAYDVVHRITPLSPIANSSLAAKCQVAGVPFVLGPLNGGAPWPKGFDAERLAEREWLSYLRGAYRLSPARSKMLRNSRAIIAGSRFTKSDLPRSVRDKVALLAENGIDPDRFTPQPRSDIRSLPLRVCFIGRLVPYKGADLLLQAAAPLVQAGEMVIDIIGNGPEEHRLKALVQELRLGDKVTFHGWVDHNGVQSILGKADVLGFPSFREFGGGVVLEAMALGVVPVICDYAGPAELVDESCGFKIPVTDRAGITTALRLCLQDIAAKPDQLNAKSRAALARVQNHFTWDQKARQITAIYHWAIDPQGPIPQPVLTDCRTEPQLRQENNYG